MDAKKYPAIYMLMKEAQLARFYGANETKILRIKKAKYPKTFKLLGEKDKYFAHIEELKRSD